MKKFLSIVGVTFAAAIAIACGGGGPTDDDANRLNEHANVNPPASATATATRNIKQITAGDWEVGTKENLNAGVITPGTYVVTAAETGSHCYYAVLNSFDEDDLGKSIASNSILQPGATGRVVAKKTHAGLRLQGDCLAKKK